MPEQSMQTSTELPVVGVFHNASDAEAAARELTKNAFAGDHISVAGGIRDNCTVPQQLLVSGRPIRDVREWLRATFRELSENDLREYENAVRDGKVLVGVNSNAQMAEVAAIILNHHSPLFVRRSDTPGQLQKHLVARG